MSSRRGIALDECAPDYLTLVLPGAPRTKKTSQRIFRTGSRLRVMPSQAFAAYQERCLVELRRMLARERARTPVLPDREYNVAAHFYRDARRGDLIGYMQALADILQAAGVLSDDRWICGWDGSRLMHDKANPRVVLTITPMEG